MTSGLPGSIYAQVPGRVSVGRHGRKADKVIIRATVTSNTGWLPLRKRVYGIFLLFTLSVDSKIMVLTILGAYT